MTVLNQPGVCERDLVVCQGPIEVANRLVRLPPAPQQLDRSRLAKLVRRGERPSEVFDRGPRSPHLLRPLARNAAIYKRLRVLSRLEEMVAKVAGTLTHGGEIELLETRGDGSMQRLSLAR